MNFHLVFRRVSFTYFMWQYYALNHKIYMDVLITQPNRSPASMLHENQSFPKFLNLYHSHFLIGIFQICLFAYLSHARISHNFSFLYGLVRPRQLRFYQFLSRAIDHSLNKYRSSYFSCLSRPIFQAPLFSIPFWSFLSILFFEKLSQFFISVRNFHFSCF